MSNTNTSTVIYWKYEGTLFPIYYPDEEAYEIMTREADRLCKMAEEDNGGTGIKFVIKRSRVLLQMIKPLLDNFMKEPSLADGGLSILECLEEYNRIRGREDMDDDVKILWALTDWVVSICILLHFNVIDNDKDNGLFTIKED